MSDTNHKAFAQALACLGTRHGSLTALSRRLGLPEATVRRWATGAHLPPPSAWLGLRAALEAAGLGEEVPALEYSLEADLKEAYGMPSRWVCIGCRKTVSIDEDGACLECGGEPIEAPSVSAVESLLWTADRLASLEQTSGELCVSCGLRARWPSPDGWMQCLRCGSAGGAA